VSIPDHIVWVAQSDFLTFTAAHKANQKTFDLKEKQFVYEIGTLERIAQEIVEFYNQLGFLTGYLTARRDGPRGEAFRAQRYPKLCAQPHINEALVATKAKMQRGGDEMTPNKALQPTAYSLRSQASTKLER